MDDLPKRKPIKRTAEAPLDALRLFMTAHAVQLTPIANQVSALPVDPELEYYFIPMQHMQEYAPYFRPDELPYKNLKLVNYGRPAISLSFYSKHKYTVRRNASQADILLHLKTFRDELLNRSLVQQLTVQQQGKLREADELFRTLRDNADQYETCFSNYHHYYRYWYCSYRYFEDATQVKAETSSEHLLKHTERIEGQVHERLNVIFIDPTFITRPVPHDHKLIDRELASFPIQIRQGVTTLYLRKRGV